MSRPIQVGDEVNVSLNNWSEFYQIHHIDGLNIYIEKDKVISLLILGKDGYQVYGAEDQPYQITFYPGRNPNRVQVLTGDPNLDIILLSRLPDQDLESICKSNKYVQSLCEGDELWQEKLVYTFGHEILSAKPEDSDLKTYYFDLIRVPLTSYGADSQIIDGNFPMLKYLYSLGIKPNDSMINIALWDGRVDIMDWLYERGIVMQEWDDPSPCAAGNNHFNSLKWLDEHGYKITSEAADYAARNERLDILKWMGNRQIFPTSYGAGEAAAKENFEIVNWLVNKGVFPDQEGLDHAAGNGHWRIVEFLAELGRLPDSDGLSLAAMNGRIDMVQWLIDQGVFPGENSTNYSAKYGRINSLDLLEKYGYLPDQMGVRLAAEAGELETLKWLADRGIVPENSVEMSYIVSKVIYNERFEVLKFLVEHGIKLNDFALQEAARKGNLDMLKFMSKYRKSGPNTADRAAEGGSLHVLDWLADKNIFPSGVGLSWAVSKGHIDVIKWAIKHGIYPSTELLAKIIGATPEIPVKTNTPRIPSFKITFTDEDLIDVLEFLIERGVELSEEILNSIRESGRDLVISWLIQK